MNRTKSKLLTVMCGLSLLVGAETSAQTRTKQVRKSPQSKAVSQATTAQGQTPTPDDRTAHYNQMVKDFADARAAVSSANDEYAKGATSENKCRGRVYSYMFTDVFAGLDVQRGTIETSHSALEAKRPPLEKVRVEQENKRRALERTYANKARDDDYYAKLDDISGALESDYVTPMQDMIDGYKAYAVAFNSLGVAYAEAGKDCSKGIPNKALADLTQTLKSVVGADKTIQTSTQKIAAALDAKVTKAVGRGTGTDPTAAENAASKAGNTASPSPAGTTTKP